MVKKILFILIIITSMFVIVGCNQSTEKPQTGSITKEVLEAIVFEGDTFEYDGKKHSIYIDKSLIPEGVTVTYSGNDKSSSGKYTVTAYIKYGDIKVIKKAVMIINDPISVIDAEDNQILMIYGGNLAPKYTINNNEQKISFKYYKDGVEVTSSTLRTPGTYTVDIIASKSASFKANVKTITVTTMFSQFGLEFNDLTVEADGQTYSIEFEGQVSDGYTVSYENNVGSEVGVYLAKAYVKDENDEIVETHAAILNILNPVNEEFDLFLDDFFIKYLEGDQLSINILIENPADFGLEHYPALWYSYEPTTEEDKEKAKIRRIFY